MLLSRVKPDVTGFRPAIAAYPDLWRGCIGAWTFDGSDVARDLTLNRHDAQVAGTGGVIAPGVGPRGKAATFALSAGDARYDLGNVTAVEPLSLAGRTSWAVSVYLTWRTPSSDYARFIDKSTGSNMANGWGVLRNSLTNTLGFGVNGAGYYSPSTFSLVDGASYILTFNVTDGVGEVFVGITSLGTVAVPAPPATACNAAIGNWNHTTNRGFCGDLYMLAVWDRALSQAEITQLAFSPYSMLERRPEITAPQGALFAAGQSFQGPGSAGLGTFRAERFTRRVLHNPSNPGGWAVGITEDRLNAAIRDAAGQIVFAPAIVNVTKVDPVQRFDIVERASTFATSNLIVDITAPPAEAGDLGIYLVTTSNNFSLQVDNWGLTFGFTLTNGTTQLKFYYKNFTSADPGGLIRSGRASNVNWRAMCAVIRPRPGYSIGTPSWSSNGDHVLPSVADSTVGRLCFGLWTVKSTGGNFDFVDPEGVMTRNPTLPAETGWHESAIAGDMGIAWAAWAHNGVGDTKAPYLTDKPASGGVLQSAVSRLVRATIS